MIYERGKGYGARVLLDSMAPSGKRLTTFELRYPRMVHAELMTHRLLSRNSASSRAIPNERLIAQVVEDPALPVWWGKNQSGMQAREALVEGPSETCRRCGARDPMGTVSRCEHDGHDFRSDRDIAIEKWLRGRDAAVLLARDLAGTGLHKNIANRVLEPWMFITVLVSATELDNFFALRDHPDAQPEIAFVVRMMHEVYKASTPRQLMFGEWHLPLVDRTDRFFESGTDRHESFDLAVEGYTEEQIKRISVGRCARVSYLTHDGKRDPAEDLKLADRLAGASPGHWSPFEHVAMALDEPTPSGNFLGWKQYRKTFKNEHVGGLRP